VILGLIGIATGVALSHLIAIESWRGDIAAWLLVGFGFVYFIWGLKRAYKNKTHKHIHVHEDGTYHTHTHTHTDEHSHINFDGKKPSITPWVLFVVFVLGPCEPLIPLLMYPAARNSTIGLIVVAIVFGLITISTMLTVVFLTLWGINFLPLQRMERYTHALGGAAICLTGLCIVFLGL
jgi:sulfite exporter TauE/SafE